MRFNSFVFAVVFLPIVAALYRSLVAGGRLSHSKVFLLAASLFFYLRSGIRNLPYLFASFLFNYFAARTIQAAQEPTRKRLLIGAIAINVAFLCSFKYVNFFGGQLASLAHLSWNLPSLAFPLGVSFFTIQQIMYLVDCYEEMSKPNSALDHAVFISFFPYISAGPITRAREVVPQLNAPSPRPVAEDVARGVTLFSIGLFKKVIFAEAFAGIADAGFQAAGTVSMPEAWGAAFAYALQIYFDFSGYSDMALGAALLLGIRIPKNFDNPLRSLSITEFWRRWHISLSNFITTYLYTPIVRSFGRVTPANSAKATILAMTIAGLWHGPNWTFVIFGAAHGVALAVNQYWKKKKKSLPDPIAWLLMMAFICFAFIFFRSPNLSVARQMLAGAVGAHGLSGFGVLLESFRSARLTVGLPALVGCLVAFFGPSSNKLAEEYRLSPALACGVGGMILVAFLFMNSSNATEFVYVAF